MHLIKINDYNTKRTHEISLYRVLLVASPKPFFDYFGVDKIVGLCFDIIKIAYV
jgi:hypothetical protein